MIKQIIGIGIIFALLFTPVSALTHTELTNVLNGYTYGREYEINVWDCSDMSINVAGFLQEELGYDTLVMYYNHHAWVLVSSDKGKWFAVETTINPMDKLGVITYDSEYYYGYYGEWNEVDIT